MLEEEIESEAIEESLLIASVQDESKIMTILTNSNVDLESRVLSEIKTEKEAQFLMVLERRSKVNSKVSQWTEANLSKFTVKESMVEGGEEKRKFFKFNHIDPPQLLEYKRRPVVYKKTDNTDLFNRLEHDLHLYKVKNSVNMKIKKMEDTFNIKYDQFTDILKDKINSNEREKLLSNIPKISFINDDNKVVSLSTIKSPEKGNNLISDDQILELCEDIFINTKNTIKQVDLTDFTLKEYVSRIESEIFDLLIKDLLLSFRVVDRKLSFK